jgi:dipeptidyl aminopeptidase/acylaminoacyl peptidase
VYGLFIAPRLDGVDGPADEAPPLVVFCHGGPTGSVEAGFDVTVQFFTTRGFAVAAVDYAGSTGHGRAFRQNLYGHWGEADSDDCVAAARHLAGNGMVDGDRMAIRGTSAGGLTALNALVRADCFAAAASWYGVTDLLGLEATTHDFEASYNRRLVGPLPATEDVWRRRSPVNRVDDMSGAVLLLYGLDDPVVPAAQARAMAAALRRRGVDCEEHAFEGESHGFRRADTVRQCLEAELAFYRRTLLGAPPPS